MEENNVMNIAAAPESLPAVNDNITDEEKQLRMASSSTSSSATESYRLTPHVESIFSSLDPSENDYEALFALSLLYAIGQNKGKAFLLVLYKLKASLMSCCKLLIPYESILIDYFWTCFRRK